MEYQYCRVRMPLFNQKVKEKTILSASNEWITFLSNSDKMNDMKKERGTGKRPKLM